MTNKIRSSSITCRYGRAVVRTEENLQCSRERAGQRLPHHCARIPLAGAM